ncbi:MAG: ATPase domain-containing protein [Candidatus Thermoplasmatota archaeon]|nr:ATPase domain-containing protein [Candidatus Thermoplasmatota archaeon]
MAIGRSRSNILRFDFERDGLHRHLGGGLPKGVLAIVSGSVGSGKSAILQRLIYGFLLHHHTINVISTEQTTKSFLSQMDSLDYPVKKSLLDGKLKFVPVFPLIGRSKKRVDFLSRLRSTPGLYEADVIAIDTFSALIKSDIDEGKALETISFLKKIIGKNRTVILGIDPQEVPAQIMGPFRSVADILLELKTEIVEGNMEHIMYVTRYTHAQGPVSTAVGFRIEPRAGFIVDITTVA